MISQLVRCHHNPHSGDRAASQLKEIVLGSHLLQAKNLLEYGAEILFCPGFRSLVCCFFHLRLRQGLLVHLLIDG